jgi:hypothetical protein
METASKSTNKSTRANASQFFVAGELCRRGLVAVVTMGNCPNTDVLVSNVDGTKFAHVQVKTFVPGNRTCPAGVKAEIDYGDKFFWVLGGIPKPDSNRPFEFYVVPSRDMSREIKKAHKHWLDTPGKKGQAHDPENKIRAIPLPPKVSRCGWNLTQYRDRWDLIVDLLKGS